MTKRANKRKTRNAKQRRIERYKRDRASGSQTSTIPTGVDMTPEAATTTGTPELLDGNGFRSVSDEANTVAKLLGLGCVPDQIVQEVVMKGYQIIVKSDKAIEYAAIMKVFIAAAKVKIESDRNKEPVRHVHAIEPEAISFSSIEADIGIN